MSESQNQDFIKLFDQLNSIIEDKTTKQKILKFLNSIMKHLKAVILCIKVSESQEEFEIIQLQHNLDNLETINKAEI